MATAVHVPLDGIRLVRGATERAHADCTDCTRFAAAVGLQERALIADDVLGVTDRETARGSTQASDNQAAIAMSVLWWVSYHLRRGMREKSFEMRNRLGMGGPADRLVVSREAHGGDAVIVVRRASRLHAVDLRVCK